MKILAAIVTSGFLIIGHLAGVANAEPSLANKTYKPDKPIVASITLQNSAQGIYLLPGYTWHTDCESQLETVQQAVDSMGLGNQWFYIHYIFSNESCVDPGRVNSIGARGLGQSLGHDSFTCGAGDIPCQIDWFNSYAMNRFGSWQAAYDYWTSHGNW